MTAEVRRRRRWGQTLGLAGILFVVVIALSAIPVIRQSELRLADTYFRIAPIPKQRSRVVLVLVDDESLRQYGRWPWSRTLLAQLTDELTQAGASAIGLDVLLSEAQSPEADTQLRNAFATAGRVVIVDKIGTYADGPRWVEPLPEFARAVAGVGHAQAVQDVDGVCRRFPPLELTPDGARWAFAVEVARRVDPERTAAFLDAYQVARTDQGDIISTARPVKAPIAFRRDGFQVISAASVLQGRNLGMVRGRPVLVGFGPAELGDRINTPLTGELPAPGVEVHAQILDSILTGRRLRETPMWTAILLLLASCVGIVWLFQTRRGWPAVGLVAVLALAWYGSCVLIFAWASRIVAAGPMLLAVAVGPLLVYTADFVLVERSVTQQLRELRGWLKPWRSEERARPADLSWRLALLRNLQTELGSLYELHKTLLEATQDPVAIFDDAGLLLLGNGSLRQIYGTANPELTLDQLRESLIANDEAPLVRAGDRVEGEAYLKGELYSVRMVPMPATSLAPGGGTIVTLTSLRARVERDRARAEALGFITHELRTPLVAIQGFAQLMMNYPQSPANTAAPETIFRESKRLVALINSYLDVLRLDAGARPLRLERIELREAVQQVFGILQPLAEARRMRLMLEGEAGIAVEADAPLISGAVLNLVSNAIKYGAAGSDISVRCSLSGEQAVMTVHNVGEPIAPDGLPAVFNPYYRTAEAEKTKPGWGLGLAFVKRIAEKHGGAVAVQSSATGTTFEIRLPAQTTVAVAGGTS